MDENEDIGLPAPGNVYSDTSADMDIGIPAPGNVYAPGNTGANTLDQFLKWGKNVLTGEGSVEDYAKLAVGLGGLYAANQSSGPTLLNPGYQGGIPEYKATREMLTAPPAGRRPGGAGINYGGDVTYTTTGKKLGEVPLPAGGITGPGAVQPGPATGGLKIPMSIFASANPNEKAAYYNQLLASGLTDAQIRAAADSQIGKQYDADWVYLQKLAESLRNPNPAPAPAPATTPAPKPAGLIPPEVLAAADPGIKAQYYNTLLGQGKTDTDIRAAAGNQTDADWAYLQKLASALRTPPPAPAPAPAPASAPAPAAAPTPAPAPLIPKSVLESQDAYEKARYYNQLLDQSKTDEQIRAAAGNQTDSDWMALQQIAEAMRTPAPAPAPATAPAPAPAKLYGQDLLASLPSNWSASTPGEKISFFNSRGITPNQLRSAGVPDGDIQWMQQNGYAVRDETSGSSSAYNTIERKAGGLAADGFVIPADVVSHFGNGSSDAGLEFLAEELGAKPIKGDGDGMSDSIPTTIDGKQPARVANDEAFVPPEMVKRLGGGDTERGAKKLYAMMDRIRKARTGTTEQGKQINPEKFMPGGKVERYQAGGAITTNPGAGLTSQSLAEWSGPYVADMLGKGYALSNMPYQAYTGPLTAGESPLQQQAFGAASQYQVPTGLAAAGAAAGQIGQKAQGATYTPVGGLFGTPEAQQYMNPYLETALAPQLRELTRQSDIQRQADAARMASAGAFGGGRQAIMESEGRRNLLGRQSDVLAQGYSTAYDKAAQQFNEDQRRKIQEAQFGSELGLKGLQTGLQAAETQGRMGQVEGQFGLDKIRSLADLGAVQRGIESEGIAADRAQFEEARLNPYKMLQFQQSMLSGLPLASQSLVQPGTSNLQQFGQGFTTIAQLLQSLGLLKKD